MNASSSSIPTKQDFVNSLSSWWGLSKLVNTGNIESRFEKYQDLKTEMNRLFQEASSAQARSLKAANERSIRYFQDIFGARQPFELSEAQSNLVEGFIENFTAQTRTWMELTRELQDCSASMVSEIAAETGEAAALPAPADAQSEEEDEPMDRKTASALLKTGREKLSAVKSRPVSRIRKK